MFKTIKSKLMALFATAAVAATNASAALTPPAADYTDIDTMAAYVVGIFVTLFLIKVAISFVRTR
ncbi:MAG: hypothetical protein ACWGHH_05690 [Sulfurovaceae bacterium]